MYGDWRTDSLFPSPAGDDTEISRYGAGLSGKVRRCAPCSVRNRIKNPKADLTAALAQVLDVSPHALSVPDIDSYVGLMHTLFTLEDNYGLKISEIDGEVCLKVDVRKNKDAARLHEMLCSWQQAAAMLEAGEISKEDYDKWRYHYPEFDATQKRTSIPSKELLDSIVQDLK